ncbi:DUF6193 family natural product biosynthesis protein [Streptacidiphilus sp. EB103A]|uniref:DUF6193 family natural product biosynthesis protein n=1 Tax=Streptacidiphilus sp. EB103A TaxID=3156275 RepID=UPI003517B3A6
MTDLAARLEQEGRRQGFSLTLQSPEGSNAATNAFLESDRGSFRVSTHAHRSFYVDLWLPGVQIGYGEVTDLSALATTLKGWQDGTPLRELQAIWPDLPLTPDAIGHEEGHAVEATWQAMLQRAPHIRLGDPDVTVAASAQPRLRALFPFPSHGTLTFLRATRFPWPPNDLPFIATSDPGYTVYAPGYKLIGKTETPPEAAALVVAHLPENCGPAYEGIWPGATESTQ